MIKLNVKDYCHECPDFEAEVDSPAEIEAYFDEAGQRRINRVIRNTIVTCKHRFRCDVLMSYLESQNNKKESE